MAKYIGNIPSVGEFKKLDSLTSTFNGSLTQFNLEYGSTSVSVGDASQLIVSLNGIIQEPLTAYTLAVGGSAIVFSSAPASTDTCHIILLGGVGGTSTVSDGAVTAAKLDAGLKDYLEETYSANGSQTTYTLTRAPIGTNDLMITIDGIVQPSTAYSVAGTTLTISPALPNGTDVRVVHMGVRAGFVVPSSSSITAAMFQDFTTDVKFNDNAKAVFGTGDDLQIYHTGSKSIIHDVTAGNLEILADDFAIKNSTGVNTLFYADAPNGAVSLYHSNAAKLATTSTGIDVTGNIIFGDNHAIVSDGNDNLVIESSSSEDVIIKAGSGVIEFRDAGESGSPLRAKIDTDGNLLVGTTTTYPAGSGVSGAFIEHLGRIEASRASAPAIRANRNTTDGGIVEFRKDGAVVGSINSLSGRLAIGTGNTGLFFDSIRQVVTPHTITGSTYSTTIDLGRDQIPFKDLYLSGGVDFGGSVNSGGTVSSSNKLDDYEEGTWTPVLRGYTTAGTSSVGTTDGTYTKIGDVVHIEIRIQNITLSGAAGQLIIAGLPFAAKTPTYATFAGPMTHGFNFNTDRNQTLYAQNNSTQISGLESINGAPWTLWSITNTSGLYLNASGTYKV